MPRSNSKTQEVAQVKPQEVENKSETQVQTKSKSKKVVKEVAQPVQEVAQPVQETVTTEKVSKKSTRKPKTEVVDVQVSQAQPSTTETPVVVPVEQVVTEVVDEADSQRKFVSQYNTMHSELRVMRENLQKMHSNFKKLDSAYRYDLKKLTQRKPKRTSSHEPTGFAKAKKVNAKLARFLNIPEGSELTGPQITSAVWKQLKDRNLTYEKDKRVFRTNNEVTEIFGVPVGVNTSTDHRDKDGFNFCNLQTYITQANRSE